MRPLRHPAVNTGWQWVTGAWQCSVVCATHVVTHALLTLVRAFAWGLNQDSTSVTKAGVPTWEDLGPVLPTVDTSSLWLVVWPWVWPHVSVGTCVMAVYVAVVSTWFHTVREALVQARVSGPAQVWWRIGGSLYQWDRANITWVLWQLVWPTAPWGMAAIFTWCTALATDELNAPLQPAPDTRVANVPRGRLQWHAGVEAAWPLLGTLVVTRLLWACIWGGPLDLNGRTRMYILTSCVVVAGVGFKSFWNYAHWTPDGCRPYAWPLLAKHIVHCCAGWVWGCVAFWVGA